MSVKIYFNRNKEMLDRSYFVMRVFMMSLSGDGQAYLDDISNIDKVYFDNMVSQIYPSELQLN